MKGMIKTSNSAHNCIHIQWIACNLVESVINERQYNTILRLMICKVEGMVADEGEGKGGQSSQHGMACKCAASKLLSLSFKKKAWNLNDELRDARCARFGATSAKGDGRLQADCSRRKQMGIGGEK